MEMLTEQTEGRFLDLEGITQRAQVLVERNQELPFCGHVFPRVPEMVRLPNLCCSWPIRRNRSAGFERSEVRRTAVEAVGHRGQRDAAVDGCGTSAQPEIEIACVVESLHCRCVLRVELRD